MRCRAFPLPCVLLFATGSTSLNFRVDPRAEFKRTIEARPQSVIPETLAVLSEQDCVPQRRSHGSTACDGGEIEDGQLRHDDPETIRRRRRLPAN